MVASVDPGFKMEIWVCVPAEVSPCGKYHWVANGRLAVAWTEALARLDAPVATTRLAPLFTVAGTTKVAENAPLLFVWMVAGTVTSAAPFNDTTICSPGA